MDQAFPICFHFKWSKLEILEQDKLGQSSVMHHVSNWLCHCSFSFLSFRQYQWRLSPSNPCGWTALPRVWKKIQSKRLIIGLGVKDRDFGGSGTTRVGLANCHNCLKKMKSGFAIFVFCQVALAYTRNLVEQSTYHYIPIYICSKNCWSPVSNARPTCCHSDTVIFRMWHFWCSRTCIPELPPSLASRESQIFKLQYNNILVIFGVLRWFLVIQW